MTLQTGSGSSSGCWCAPSWADATAFPTEGLTVGPGQTSPIHTISALHVGAAPVGWQRSERHVCGTDRER